MGHLKKAMIHTFSHSWAFNCRLQTIL